MQKRLFTSTTSSGRQRRVTTFVNGVPLRTWTTYSSLMNVPQTVLLTIWASSSAGRAGPLQTDSAPTSAEVDWIKVYDWPP
jgi:beta-glucanase (GH16 family)